MQVLRCTTLKEFTIRGFRENPSMLRYFPSLLMSTDLCSTGLKTNPNEKKAGRLLTAFEYHKARVNSAQLRLLIVKLTTTEMKFQRTQFSTLHLTLWQNRPLITSSYLCPTR